MKFSPDVSNNQYMQYGWVPKPGIKSVPVLNYERPISSDVNGSAVVGTGEIKKTHIHVLLLYTLSCKFYLTRVASCFICKNIQTFVYDAFLLYAIQKQDRLTRRSISTRNMKALFNYDRREN